MVTPLIDQDTCSATTTEPYITFPFFPEIFAIFPSSCFFRAKKKGGQ
jgi:hypothetical protein